MSLYTESAALGRDAIGSALDLVFGEPHEGDVDHTHADNSTANALLDDEPATNSRDGVAQCFDWGPTTQAWDDPLVRNS